MISRFCHISPYRGRLHLPYKFPHSKSDSDQASKADHCWIPVLRFLTSISTLALLRDLPWRLLLWQFLSGHSCPCRVTLIVGLPPSRVAQIMASWQPGCGKMERDRENEEEMEREWGNGKRFTLNISSFSVKNCHILSQNVKYGTFVANVTKNLTYALWDNNSVRKLCKLWGPV